MKLKYGNQWITGVPWQEDAGGVQWSGQQLVQNVPLPRGTTPFIAGRGNVFDTITVPVVRTFSSSLKAIKHMAELPWNLPNHGELVFYEQEGDAVQTITYARAAYNGVTRRRVGQLSISINLNFTVKGAPVVNTDAELAFEIYTEDGQSLTTES